VSARTAVLGDGENGGVNGMRDGNGRFAVGNRGGPGRPRGSLSRATVDASEIKRRLLASWERVDGDRLLDQLAADDPKAYLKLVRSLIPRDEAAGERGEEPLTLERAPALMEKFRRPGASMGFGPVADVE